MFHHLSVSLCGRGTLIPRFTDIASAYEDSVIGSFSIDKSEVVKRDNHPLFFVEPYGLFLLIWWNKNSRP